MNVQSSDISSKVKAAFNFSVDKFPLSGPDGMRTPEYGLFRSDNGEYVTSRAVRKGYVPHQTADVVALTEAATEAFDGEVDLKFHFDNGHYVSIRPTMAHRHSVFGTADNIFPRFTVSANYGTGAFYASMGMYRDLCRNMSMLRKVSGVEQKIRHSTDLPSKMDDLIDDFQALRGSWDNVVEAVEQMESNQVRFQEFLAEIYTPPEATDSQNTHTRYTNRIEAIFKRLRRERIQAGKPDLGPGFEVSGWEAFNAVQGYVQWDMPRKGDPSDFARVIRGTSDSAVKKAEELALAV